jgi:Tfp pilus assembly protein PilX
MHMQQTGSALAISLVLLTAISLVSITSLQRTNLQSRIVANSQHAEAAFQIVNNDLEEKLRRYANDPVSASALSDTIDMFEITGGEKAYKKTDTTGVVSSYQNDIDGHPRKIQIASNIIHTGQPPFSSGNSQGSFTTFQFEATTTASTGTVAEENYRVLSSQITGIEFIGPSLN